MNIKVCTTKFDLGKQAADLGAKKIKEAIDIKGEANIILATGASQFEMLNELIKKDIDWSKVNGFHLDEYIGIKESHPASFRKYLKERVIEKINIKMFTYINGEGDTKTECERLNNIIKKYPIDVAFIGIGENTHLAFNDPPADFEKEDPYFVVELDEACRMQQLGEGWFKNFEEVPHQAISMSIKQILKSQTIICSVPDKRKADAVYKTLNNSVTNKIPSTILQDHNNTYLFLDDNSASKLN